MKRFLLIFAVACLVLSMFAACGETNPQETTDPRESTQATEQTAPSQESVTTEPVEDTKSLTIYHSLNEAVAFRLDESLADFREQHPQWEVSLRKADDDLAAAGGVVLCTTEEMAALQARDVLLELDSLIAKEDEQMLSDIYPIYLEEGKQFVSGKTYGLPVMRTSMGLYYNVNFFETNGLSTPFTWDEMETLCAQIKELDPEATPLVIAEPSEWFITLCAQSQSPYLAEGEDPVQFDNATNREFVKRFQQWVKKGYLTTDAEVWRNGSACMLVGYCADALEYRPSTVMDAYPFETDITLLPQDNLSTPAVIARGYDVALLRTGDEELSLMSWELAKYMVTDLQFQATFPSEAGYTPMLMTAENESVYLDFIDAADGGDNIVNLGAVAGLSQQMICTTMPAYPVSATARRQVQVMMEKCLQPDGDVAAAFKEAVEACKQ